MVLAPIPADGEIERFLKEADVVSTKSTKKGVTDSLRATLSDGKLTHDAHIQNIDETKREFRTNQGVEFDFRDSWTFNIAAYKIDRLIGLNMVPPSISRTPSLDAGGVYLVDRRRPDGRRRQGQEQGRSRPIATTTAASGR